jgi:hypothetical protein
MKEQHLIGSRRTAIDTMKQLTFKFKNGYRQSMDGERKRDGGTSRGTLHGVGGGGETEEPPTIASRKLKSALFLCEEHPRPMVESCDEIMHFNGGNGR